MTASELRYDGQTVVVTGAGAGLGRAYAVFFGSRGANVVVNDLGGNIRGEGGGIAAADAVVQEIKGIGGSAVPDHNDVLNGDRIIDTAIKNFGRIDVLINNAGILRDVSFKNMTDNDWDLIMNVHVVGAYRCTHAAWPYFQKQNYGRVINTASAAGLFGAFGQCNYSAAKLSQVGFTEALAKEGKRSNILCNVIAPIAASRLTATVLPPEVLNKLKPEWVVPLVAVLVHPSNARETGSIFEVGAGQISRFRWQRAAGASFQKVTPLTILDHFDMVSDFSNKATFPAEALDVGQLAGRKEIAPTPGSHTLLSGKVALVMNGGSNKGRLIARSLAQYGAAVVVHDSKDPSSAVDDINNFGGRAAGVTAAVVDAEKIVKTAVAAYGSIHILVHSLGPSEEQSFTSGDPQSFQHILRVNLRDLFAITKAVWPIFLKQKFGRIVNMSSTSGVYGEENKVAFSTATAGALGFSRALALEGKKYNIFVNAIAPNTQHGAASVGYAPLLTALCSDRMPEPATGRLFEMSGRWIGEVRWQRSGGHAFSLDEALTPEVVLAQWSEITTFDDGRADHPNDQLSGQRKIMANMENTRKSSSSDEDNTILAKIASVQKAKPNTIEYAYDHRDVILYNKNPYLHLGIGAKRTDLPLIYEGHPDFQVLPTFGVIPSFMARPHFTLDELVPSFNHMKVLHGEQFLQINHPIPTTATLLCSSRLVEVVDKGKAAAITTGTTVKDMKTGRELFYAESLAFVRDSGGFGGKRKGTDRGAATRSYQVPAARKPDGVVEDATNPEQAALYRLCGDYNPLHVDPESSKVGGFEIPILHGLCFFGVAVKAVWQTYGQVKNVKVRFTNTVLPGQTIVTEMWKDGNTVIFQARIKETGKLCISGGGAELLDGSPKGKL